jgi:hypothetical protein
MLGIILKHSMFGDFKTYRSSSGLSNFLGFLGQQSQMNKPPIFGPVCLGTFRLVCKDIFLATFILGGSRVLGPGTLLNADWLETPTGELGLRRNLSWKDSRSEFGERPPGERSYAEVLVTLLPPTERAADE